MEVRPGDPPCGPHLSEHIASLENISYFCADLRQVPVKGVDPQSMIQNDGIAREKQFIGQNHPAALRSRVVLADELFFAGNTVVLDHGLGIYTFYGHLSEISARAGDILEAGDVLGKVGATGRVTGPHLHWGLTVERARVNPLQIVKLLGP